VGGVFGLGDNVTTYDVVKKLIGPIEPVGETREDDRRLSNLADLHELMALLVRDLHDVARESSRHEHSRKQAGQLAESSLRKLGIPEDE